MYELLTGTFPFPKGEPSCDDSRPPPDAGLFKNPYAHALTCGAASVAFPSSVFGDGVPGDGVSAADLVGRLLQVLFHHAIPCCLRDALTSGAHG